MTVRMLGHWPDDKRVHLLECFQEFDSRDQVTSESLHGGQFFVADDLPTPSFVGT